MLKTNPTLNCIVQDIDGCSNETSEQPVDCVIISGEFEDQIQFMRHNFFQPQPIAPTAYFMRFIRHDHADERARDILRALLPQIEKNQSTLLIMEMIRRAALIMNSSNRFQPDIENVNIGVSSVDIGRAEPDVEETWEGLSAEAGTDLLMMSMFNGKERSGKNSESCSRACMRS